MCSVRATETLSNELDSFYFILTSPKNGAKLKVEKFNPNFMNSHEQKVSDFLKKSDEELLIELEKNTRELPEAILPGAILQIRLNKNITNLKQEIKKLNKTTSFYSKWLVALTIVLAILTLLLLFK